MTGIEEVALVTMIASAAGTAVSAYGAYQQGQFQKASSDYQAAAANQDAQIAQEQAQAQQVQDVRTAYLRQSSAEAAYGESGTSGGAATDVLGDIASQSKRQEQEDLYQGALKGRGSQETATVESASGAAAATGGTVTAGASLLGGAARTGSTYMMLSRPGQAGSTLG